MGNAWVWSLKGLCLLVILIRASREDIRSRQVPDRYSVYLLLLALILPDVSRLWGIFCTCPLLIAALTFGGIGGADIKMMGAAGMVLGLDRGMAALILGLSFMMLFHTGKRFLLRNSRREQSYPLIPFLAIGIGVSYLTLIPR